MNSSELATYVMTFLPAAVRIAAVMVSGPMLALRCIPLSIRLTTVAGFTALVAPLASGTAMPLEPSWELMMRLVQEALVGSLLGLSLWLMIGAIRVTGEVIEGLCGFSLAGMLDPQTNTQDGGPVTRLYWWTMFAVFVSAGGIGQMVAGLLKSFEILPPGSAAFDGLFISFLAASLSSSFEMGLRVAMPAMLALFAAAVVLGMVQRNFPQLGGMQIGLGIKSLLGMVMTSIVLISAPWVISGGLQNTLDQYTHLLNIVSTRSK